MTDKLIKAIRHWTLHPVDAVKDWFGATPDDYQADIINSLLGAGGGNRTAVKSGHGVGKTTTEAWLHWVFLVTRAHSRIPATAPTQAQLRDILWPEIAKWHNRMPYDLKAMFEVSEMHVRHKQEPKTWFSVARTSNKSDNLQGFHNDHVLVLVEEASGIPPGIFEVIEGIMSNAAEHGQEAKLFMAGNPTQTSGEFYNAFRKNKMLYSRFTISGDPILPKDPNGGRIYASKRVTEAYRQTMAKKYGINSPVYDVRVRGVFPEIADRAVIPLAWAERAQYNAYPHFDQIADVFTLVMDAARFGGDETTLGLIRGGQMVSLKAWPKTSTNECVDILWEAQKHLQGQGFHVGRIIVDEPGVGGGVIDSARRVGLAITPYHGGKALSEANGDPEDDVRMFANRRSRDWWYLRRRFELGTITIPVDEVLVNQLASVEYEYSNRDKIEVESKGKMRERLGDDASPDRADTLVMGLAPYYSLVNAVPMEILTPDAVMFGNDRPTAEMDF